MKQKRIVGTIAVAMLLAVLLCAMTMPVSAHEYHREIAAKYALANAYRDIPASQYFERNGGDCTNFVSWHLQLAGWREIGSVWNRKSDSSWFYDFVPGGHSYSWGGADNFYRFLSRSDRVYPVSIRYKSYQLEIGDVVQIDNKDKYGNKVPDGSWDHTMIVTAKVGNRLFLSGHSPKEGNTPLSAIIERNNQNARFIGWHLRDTYYN